MGSFFSPCNKRLKLGPHLPAMIAASPDKPLPIMGPRGPRTTRVSEATGPDSAPSAHPPSTCLGRSSPWCSQLPHIPRGLCRNITLSARPLWNPHLKLAPPCHPSLTWCNALISCHCWISFLCFPSLAWSPQEQHLSSWLTATPEPSVQPGA